MGVLPLPVPKRYNPSVVKIQQVDLGGIADPLVVDDVFGEVVGGQDKVFGSELVLDAQVQYVHKDETEKTAAGDSPMSDGHLTFTLEHLRDKSLDPLGGGNTIKKGDKITEIAGVATAFRIIEVRPTGHLRGRPNLWQAFFEEDQDQIAEVR